jgi:hypothetical protein
MRRVSTIRVSEWDKEPDRFLKRLLIPSADADGTYLRLPRLVLNER